MLKTNDGKDVNFWKSRDFITFVLGLTLTLSILGAFWYGGHTACKLGDGYYYKFACVDLEVVEVPQNKVYADMWTPIPDCASAVVKDNIVYCSDPENLTLS